MREIKFRAWCKLDKILYDWEQVKKEFTLEYFDDRGFVFQQYTGLKDKNGVEIYEGDIVFDRWANAYTPVFQNGIYMAYSVDCLYLTKQEPSTQFNVVWKDVCEVIGNIYENPELLETKKRLIRRQAKISHNKILNSRRV